MNGQLDFSMINMIEEAGAEDIYVKMLLTGVTGTGKSTSVLHGAPKPLLVIDIEKGTKIYRNQFSPQEVKFFPSPEPEHILLLTQQLLAAQQAGMEIPYKSVFIDSGTDVYKRIMNDEIKRLQVIKGDPNKRSLEPKEYAYPKGIFYDIIKNLKELKIHLYVSCHAVDNYMKGSFMQVDPNEPLKPDCDAKLTHEMDIHVMFKKFGAGKTEKIIAEVKKSRLEDKDGNPLLPKKFDSVNNRTFIKDIHELVNREVGFVVEKPVVSNVIKTDAVLSDMQDEIIDIAMNHLRMSSETAVQAMLQLTNGQVGDPYALTREQAGIVLEQFRKMREQMIPQQEG